MVELMIVIAEPSDAVTIHQDKSVYKKTIMVLAIPGRSIG